MRGQMETEKLLCQLKTSRNRTRRVRLQMHHSLAVVQKKEGLPSLTQPVQPVSPFG